MFYVGAQKTFFGLQNILKTSSRHVLKTPSRRLQCKNLLPSKTFARRLAKTSWKTKSVTLNISWRPKEYLLGRNIYICI